MSLMAVGVSLLVFAAAWNVTTTILIYTALQKRDVNASFLFLRFFIPKYASHYKEITLKETGKIGVLFYHWIVSINIALLATILMLMSIL